MNLIEAIRNNDLRVNNGDRWLVIEPNGDFIVYQRKHREKQSRILLTTADEASAVKALCIEELLLAAEGGPWQEPSCMAGVGSGEPLRHD
jgi:hypothetical protein